MRLLVRSPMSTARTIVFLLQAILVTVGVKSACLKEDCTGQAITVVDPSSGECVSCFPCPQCEEGQTPSVRCASTVPQGTDIHCVLIEPSPSLVSTLVFSWHASITRTSRQITATTHTHERPTVSATSSKDYAGSSSSITVDTESNDKENTGYSIKDHFKMGNKTVVYLFCGVSLPLIFLCILCRLRKSKTTRFHQPIGNQTTPSSTCSLMTGATPADNSVHGTVDLHHENSRALYLVRSYTNSGQTFPEGNVIPPSLDDNHAQGLVPANPELPDVVGIRLDAEGNENSRELCSSAVVTENHSPLDDLTSNQPTSVSHEFQNRLLTGKMATIPLRPFYRNICNKLDIEQPFWDDYRMFGEKIDLSRDEILLLGQKQQPTHSMLQRFDSQKNSSVGKFKIIMENMDRHDVVTIINEWINYEWGKVNNQATMHTVV